MSTTALDRAIKAAGGGKELAAKCGVSPMAVSQWKKRGLPAERVRAVVRAADGKVLAHELRPDLYDVESAQPDAAAA
ncbi:YdaS family helix-turn-helix protein [Pseudomonas sp. MGal98]|uniref:transcriptional regulator n=1 Tax=Pseudomonas sp. MGal98 TaxID=3162460 RepID=UPI0032F05C6D